MALRSTRLPSANQSRRYSRSLWSFDPVATLMVTVALTLALMFGLSVTSPSNGNFAEPAEHRGPNTLLTPTKEANKKVFEKRVVRADAHYNFPPLNIDTTSQTGEEVDRSSAEDAAGADGQIESSNPTEPGFWSIPAFKSTGNGKVEPREYDAHPFVAYARKHGNLKHIDPRDLLWLGGAHSSPGHRCFGKNAEPKPDRYANLLALAALLDALVERIGALPQFTSIHREPAYNNCVGGAEFSAHMASIAGDFWVDGMSACTIAMELNAMRAERIFQGGIGVYHGFVHVDLRGTKADWGIKCGYHGKKRI